VPEQGGNGGNFLEDAIAGEEMGYFRKLAGWSDGAGDAGDYGVDRRLYRKSSVITPARITRNGYGKTMSFHVKRVK
jgi:hypothetical protein